MAMPAHPRWKRSLFGDNRDPQEELSLIFAEPITGPGAQPSALRWGSTQLASAGVDPRTQQLRAITVLRAAEPQLGLKSAKYLTYVLASA